MRWHLLRVQQQTGKRPAQLDIVRLPVEVAHIWEYFLRLNAKRTNGGMAPNPISDEQVLAWQTRHRIRLDPFESDCIDALDQVFLSSSSEKSSNTTT